MDAGALHAPAAAVDQPDLDEPGGPGCRQVLLDDVGDLARGERVEVDGVPIGSTTTSGSVPRGAVRVSRREGGIGRRLTGCA